MCSGKSRREQKKREAKRRAKEEKKRQKELARQRQAELDRIAQERTRIAEQQAAQMRRMQAQQAEIQAEQEYEVNRLRQKYRDDANMLQLESNYWIERAEDYTWLANRDAEKARERTTALQAEAQRVKEQSVIDVRNLNTTNNALASSLKILAQGPQTPGPSAKQSKGTRTTTGAKTTTTGLRIGSQPRSTGANLAV